MTTTRSWLISSVLALALTFVVPNTLWAHCDGLDGPVVKAAQKALETRNVALVLIWVQPTDEPEIRAAFDKTLAVRRLGPQALELADRFFFETLVRVHRAGEGAPYTGLKPAGRDLGPPISAADTALDTGRAEPVVALFAKLLDEGINQHFRVAAAARNFRADDVSAGRHYVQAYVQFIHYVERLYEAIQTPAQGHHRDAESH